MWCWNWGPSLGRTLWACVSAVLLCTESFEIKLLFGQFWCPPQTLKVAQTFKLFQYICVFHHVFFNLFNIATVGHELIVFILRVSCHSFAFLDKHSLDAFSSIAWSDACIKYTYYFPFKSSSGHSFLWTACTGTWCVRNPPRWFTIVAKENRTIKTKKSLQLVHKITYWKLK